MDAYRLSGVPIAVNSQLVPPELASSVTVENFLPSVGIAQSHAVALTSMSSSGLAATFTPNGEFLTTGCAAGHIYTYDTSRLTTRAQAISHVAPMSVTQDGPDVGISDVMWNASCDRLLVGTAGIAARVLDLEGEFVCQTGFGNPAVRNLHRNPGHVGAITSVAWDPTNKTCFMTASEDGSARIFDAADDVLKQKFVIKHGVTNPFGARTPIARAMYTAPASVLTLGRDGTVQMWDAARLSTRKCVSETTATADEACGLAVDGTTLAVRTRREMLIYDSRNLSKGPVVAMDKLPAPRDGPCDVVAYGGHVVTVTGTCKDMPPLSCSLVVCSQTTKQAYVRIGGEVGLRRIAHHEPTGKLCVTSDSGTCFLLWDPTLSPAVGPGLALDPPRAAHFSGMVVAVDEKVARCDKPVVPQQQQQQQQQHATSGAAQHKARIEDSLRKRVRDD